MKKLLLLTALILSTLASAAQTYRNPVIAGFHPDPSVCRVGNDFYLVNSSFQYFPGVPVFHSRDLVNWQQIGNVLDRNSQLPLKGASSWLGIYAPTIRYHEGTYYMITTNVGGGGNFMVTATDPRGPWSEPIWLKQQGIDPSLYFENGRCYMVSNPDNTIMLCEINPLTGEQLSDSRPLWQGTGGRYPEGPHIYKKDGYYYLLISEGGTELAHSLTIARSRNIEGPYEANPANPLLTNCSMQGQTLQIQGTGHGDFVQAADGSWWMVFLAYRNYGGSYHHLGRETCLVPVVWEPGEWPVVNGGRPADTLVQAVMLPQAAVPVQAARTTFESGRLGPEWVYIQNPVAANYQFAGGKLRLYGAAGLTENNSPTFLGRRQQSARMTVETEVELHADGTAAADARAGLSVYQIHDGHFDLVVSSGEVAVYCILKSLRTRLTAARLPVGSHRVKLRITSDGSMYRFAYAAGDQPFVELTAHDCSLVSTEVAGGFTGVVLGMFAEGSHRPYADFSYFDYRENTP